MPTLLPPAPTPALANATLDASGSVCYSGPCSYAFELVCSNTTITKNGTSPTAIITTGKGATGYDINMLNVPAGTSCNATVVVTDSNTATTATATAILQVSVSTSWLQVVADLDKPQVTSRVCTCIWIAGHLKLGINSV